MAKGMLNENFLMNIMVDEKPLRNKSGNSNRQKHYSAAQILME